MKKALTALTPLLLLLFLWMSCKKDEQLQPAAKGNAAVASEKESVAKGKAVRIGLSLPDCYHSVEQALITKFAAAQGVQVMMQIANYDKMLQNEQIENLVLQGIRVVIVVAEDGSSAATAVDEAAKTGASVIAYDRLVKSPHLAAYISFDNVEVGRAQARGILKRVDKGNFVLLYGSPTDNNAMLFRNGQIEILRPLIEKGRIKVVAEQWVENWSASSARTLMKSILSAQHNRVDAVVASNDEMALGALEALKTVGLEGKVPISGQDATAEGCISIVKGGLTFTIYKDVRLLTQLAVDMAVSLVKGEPLQDLTLNDLSALTMDKNLKGRVPCRFLSVVEVDSSNIYERIVKSGVRRWEDVYPDVPGTKKPPGISAVVSH